MPLHNPQQSIHHAAKVNMLKIIMSIRPYLFICTFLAKKGASGLRRDLNSNPGGWPARESLCKAGQITITFVFSFPILFNRAGVRCRFHWGLAKEGVWVPSESMKVVFEFKRLNWVRRVEDWLTSILRRWQPAWLYDHPEMPLTIVWSRLHDCILVQY